MIAFAILFLVAAIWLAVCALRPQMLAMPLDARTAKEIVLQVLSSDENQYERRFEGLIGDVLSSWISVNEQLHDALLRKTRRLEFAQEALVASALVIVALTLTSLVVNPAG